MKILGICGTHKKSPEPSASEFLLKEALKAAKELGSQVESLRLIDYNIKRCKGCESCLEGNPCPIYNDKEDEMLQIYKKMESADAYIFSFPVYGLIMPSIMSDLFTRLTAFEKLNIDYYNFDRVVKIKGRILAGKWAGYMAVATGIGASHALDQHLPGDIAVKLTPIISCGISLFEYDYNPNIKKQDWAKPIEQADFAIDIARAVGKRVVTGASAFDPVILSDNTLQEKVEDSTGNMEIKIDVSSV